MAKSNYLTTIAIDSARSAFHFYSMIGNNKSMIAHYKKGYTAKDFDEDFFRKFKDAVKKYAAETPSESIRRVTVVLPDSAVLTDAIKVPTLGGHGQTKKMLDVTLGGLYRNYNDLRIMSYLADQNRQYSTFAVSAVKKYIISSIYAACSENKMLVDTLTFESGATVAGAVMQNPKLKNASYLLLDIKDVCSRFVFVVNGKAVGYYTLPFGLEFMVKPKVTQEDMLFDHSYAELTVLNARERAKSKKLTVMALDSDEDDSEIDETEETSDEDDVADENDEGATLLNEIIRPAETQKIFTRKAPRKLPKFMLREISDNPKEIVYENFRVFIKWALTLMQENGNLIELGKPESVCVNMPKYLSFLIDMANKEAEENGILFTHLPYDKEDPEVSANLELYGGLFPKQINPVSKF